MAVDWSELPPELLNTIAKKLKIHIDYIRFRAVCLNWRISSPKTPNHLPSQLPWLMLSQNQTDLTYRRGFFSLSDKKVHFLNLPEASNHRRRRGSSHGWLLILDETPTVFLLNPLTRSQLPLPPLSTFPNILSFDFHNVGREYSLRTPDGELYTSNLKEMRDSFIKKLILSSSPSNESDYVALAMLNETGDLAYCKNGEHCWSFIEDAQSYSEDVIYHKGLFYAVNKFGELAVCDVHGKLPKVSFIETQRQIGGDMQYLVSFMEEVLLVTRYLVHTFDHLQYVGYNTSEFRVFRLDLSGPKWERVTSLDDRVLFVGENSSLALLASDFPGCKGNCIYYTDDYSESNFVGVNGDNDLGVYSLEYGFIQALPRYQRNSYSGCRFPSPIWVTPNPC